LAGNKFIYLREYGIINFNKQVFETQIIYPEINMTDDKKKNTKLRAIFVAIIFSILLMFFPVASGVIVTINDMDTLKSYWIQGFFMMLSLTIPAIFLLITKMRLSQIGFVRIEKGSIKTLLYFIPLIAAKIGFLLFGINKNISTFFALVFFTIAIGLSEEIYFRGIMLRRLLTCHSVKHTVILSSTFFAVVHASQAFSGTGFIITALTIVNAFIFGIVASEIVILTNSLTCSIIWHALYNFINWVTLAKGETEVILILIQSIIMIIYAIYLWSELPDKQKLMISSTQG
jgi:uncharacterized protein